jgi:hypothetical protein
MDFSPKTFCQTFYDTVTMFGYSYIANEYLKVLQTLSLCVQLQILEFSSVFYPLVCLHFLKIKV